MSIVIFVLMNNKILYSAIVLIYLISFQSIFGILVQNCTLYSQPREEAFRFANKSYTYDKHIAIYTLYVLISCVVVYKQSDIKVII